MIVDLRDALCLACFSSLLSERQAGHITECCKQVICESCIQSNPRLATYQPCLACLGGVGATRGDFRSQNISKAHNITKFSTATNDSETMFVLGDDSDEDTEEQDAKLEMLASSASSPSVQLPPAYQDVVDPVNDPISPLASPSRALSPDTTSQSNPNAYSVSAIGQRTYYIDPCDTVHGIALRFGVDVCVAFALVMKILTQLSKARELCRTNGLPISTLSTTPHLLHTRALLTLPPTSKPIPLQFALSKEDQMKRDAQRARERAEKRLQMVTKEVDWRIAKTYVSLADSPEFEEDTIATLKCKESLGSDVPHCKSTTGGPSSGLESKAVDMYLEDQEWEQQELGAGRSLRIPQIPFPNKRAVSGSFAKTK